MSDAFVVVDPDGEMMVEPFANITDALVYMRLFARPGSKVLLEGVVLAVRVAASGKQATFKGALGRKRGRKGSLDALLEEAEDLDEGD